MLIPAGCWYAIRSVKYLPDRAFIALIATVWLVSRWIVVFAFPGYVLTGDEDNLHRFVIALASGGLGDANLAGLSSQYDYPVWLSRAFPIYYAFRVWFSGADLLAVRVANAVFGAGTLVFAFLIGRRLAGSAYARAAAWLLTLFPYHLFDVLSYTPQIPGTFFFVAGVWFALGIRRPLPDGRGSVVLRGAMLGGLMLLAGIQRGGIDLLLLLLLVVTLGFEWVRRRQRPGLAALVALIAVWLPARSAMGAWIESHDVQHQRSHVLGFMTRGWSVASLGEYLARYEQLDVVTPPGDKQRVLLSVLATEVVRQPVATLVVVPLVKAGKFFAVGYAALAEEGLAQGGYDTAARIAKALNVAYAPFLLLLCITGLMASAHREWWGWRLAPLLLVSAMAAGAVVLVWETSPRYSHPIHFALATIAAVGFGALRRPVRLAMPKNFVITVAVTGFVWLAIGAAVYAAARQAKSLQFDDLRSMAVEIGGRRLESSPLNRWTGAWEEVVIIDPNVALPATLRIDRPATPGRVGMSVWLPDSLPEGWASYRILIPAEGGAAPAHTFSELERMKRGSWQQSIELRILPPEHTNQPRPHGPLRLAIGYVLAEPL